ncbi:glycoside hydrolase family 32 protein [Nocardiopsis sp. EMB25]|uniref:glycoside hydrolase family 32 protein n=1 Tax=Nocardiopsis sp. EMB25 TaxID=2835867 RepID=UPI002283AAB4|nr:glycoside hydrolase family 32 protein [Nocardiopsis sp. EMB25]MCY9783234.1 glycoside hydrolase family 32 protein [Nocardiopsis sp. EMB25]
MHRQPLHRTPRRRSRSTAALAVVTALATGAALTLTAAAPGSATADHPHRPQLHFTPAENWMNDPNGLVHHDGRYHLYFQYNPEGDQWGNMSWGHATSPDLIHWEQQPLAIPYTDQEHVFSGGVVFDEHNTSGLGTAQNPPLVAVYTSAHTDASDRPGIQAQSLAYSLDGGYTWERYEGNPVLDIGDPNFRDPKVFWYEEGGYWVMAAVVATDHVVHFYRSDDLLEWEFLSDFGPAHADGGIWEVPDLFELPVDGDPDDTRWVLIVNLNPGSVAGGSGAQYFVGDFDGTTFTPEHLVDSGPPEGEVFADFESGYGDWEVINDLDGTGGDGPFGTVPAQGTLPGQQHVYGYEGEHLLNSFVGGDAPRGHATSPEFTIDRDHVNLLVGGGNHPNTGQGGDASVNLVVDGEVVRTATGRDSEHLDWVSWDVSDLVGRTARLRVNDDATGGWGHILLDHVVLSDHPQPGLADYDWLDWGRDYYAAVSYNDTPDGARITMAWMSNWQYAGALPTTPWRGQMALPRQLELETIDGRPRLVQNPVDQLQEVYEAPLYQRVRVPVGPGGHHLVDPGPGQAHQVEVTLRPNGSDEIGLRVHDDGDQATVIGYDTEAGELFVDRTRAGNTGFHHAFPSRGAVPLPLEDGTLRLRVVVDTSSVEVFAADGRAALTHLAFPDPSATGVTLYTRGGNGLAEEVTVRPLTPHQAGAAQ